ncbi:MAG TPA: ABC-three component system protein [Cyclobacteriaceae bacterium]|nr:ABC-three component system protein [Ferruginibacter sp.]HMJ70343.1 ABC-three component system protein [Cyclobacteriaceae bacterium]
MTDEEFKMYNVIVENGSGCFFQPIADSQHTYILSSKHLFEGERIDNNGNKVPFNTEDGASIDIRRLEYKDGQFTENKIDFALIRGSNYFPHKSADACILKVPFQSGFGKICQQETSYSNSVGYKLYGFPSNRRANDVGKNDTTYEITGFTLPANDLYGAQLQNTTLNREDIQGMSGGGILRRTETCVIIAGIQSEVASAHFAAGQIFFTPIRLYQEIIDDPSASGKLTKLYPPYLGNFSFLKDEAFILDVDAFTEQTIKYVRITLHNKAQKIIESDVTPEGIKQLFKEKLLIIEDQKEELGFKALWIAWLEFLTILNIVKYDNIDMKTLSDIFTNYRLKYINIDDWTDPDFRQYIGKADYTGLKANSNIFISSRRSPKSTHRIDAGQIIDITKPYDKTGFRTDKGLDPFTSFNFIHLDYFKTKCIVEKSGQYKELPEEKLLEILKQEYNELFS